MPENANVTREQPSCIAIIICNDVIEDKRSNNKTLVGLFNGIMAQGLPCTHPRMYIMASLTGGAGRWPISFRVYGPSNQEILRAEGEEVFADPLEVKDFVLELVNVPLSEEGVHFINLFCGNTLLSERRFAVQVIKPE
jgi:Family of unknown function (DUF6941)